MIQWQTSEYSDNNWKTMTPKFHLLFLVCVCVWTCDKSVCMFLNRFRETRLTQWSSARSHCIAIIAVFCSCRWLGLFLSFLNLLAITPFFTIFSYFWATLPHAHQFFFPLLLLRFLTNVSLSLNFRNKSANKPRWIRHENIK